MWRIFHAREFLDGPFVQEFAELIRKNFQSFDYVAGIGRKGGFLGSCISYVLKLGFLTISPETISIGKETYRLKQLISHTNDRVIIVDDILVTGITYRRIKKRLEDVGFRVVGGAVIIWDDIKGVKQIPSDVLYLCSLSELLSSA